MITQWASAWASWYANSAILRTSLGFAHVGGLVASAGPAFMIDRAILRAVRAGSTSRGAHLAEIEASHPLVLGGLLVVVVSGLLLMAADLDTFLHSVVFWIKMGLIALLLANGWRLRRLGQAAAAAHPSGQALGRAAVMSLVLWSCTILAGSTLPNV